MVEVYIGVAIVCQGKIQLSAYRVAGIESQKTWAGLWSNTKDIALQALGQGTQPLFEAIKYELTEITNKIVTIDDKTKSIKWNPAFLSGVEELRRGVTSVIAEVYRLGMLLDKIGAQHSRIGSLVPFTKPGVYEKENEAWRKRYMASERALQDMAMREAGWKPVTPDIDKRMREAAQEKKKFEQTQINVGSSSEGTQQLLRYYRELGGAKSPWIQTPGGDMDEVAKKLGDKWADTLRDIDADIAKKGLPEFEQKMIDIANKWAKLKEQFKDIPGSGKKIAAGQEAEEREAFEKQYEDYLARQIKASEEARKQADATEESIQKGLQETTEETKKAYAERRAAREAEINSQLAELDIAEKAGTFHRDTIKERIRLEEERLAGQQADLAMMAKQADPTAWYAQSAAIDATRLKIIGLKDELMPLQARLRQFADQATDLWKNVGDAVQRTFDNMNETLVEFTMTGKLNFTDFANSVIRDLLRILYYQSITGPLAMGINGWIQGLSGGGAGASPGTGGVPTYITHTGGVMGEAGLSYRIVPAFAFAGAPRFHGGFAPDEYPAVLQRGEGVFTAGQMKALGALINGDAAPARAIENHYATTVQMTINALDSRSVSQTLAQHQAEIVGIVNLAYNKRGQRGPLGS